MKYTKGETKQLAELCKQLDVAEQNLQRIWINRNWGAKSTRDENIRELATLASIMREKVEAILTGIKQENEPCPTLQ